MSPSPKLNNRRTPSSASPRVPSAGPISTSSGARCPRWSPEPSWAMRPSAWLRNLARTFATLISATGSSCRAPSPAASAPIAGRATTRSATKRTRMALAPDRLLRWPENDRPLPGPPSGKGAHPVRQRRTGQASRQRHRRAGDPDLRHLSHRLVRREARRDQERRHRLRLRLRPRGSIRHRQR